MPIDLRPTLARIRGIPRQYPVANKAIQTALRPGDAARRVVNQVSRSLGIPFSITGAKPSPRPVPGHQSHGISPRHPPKPASPWKGGSDVGAEDVDDTGAVNPFPPARKKRTNPFVAKGVRPNKGRVRPLPLGEILGEEYNELHPRSVPKPKERQPWDNSGKNFDPSLQSRKNAEYSRNPRSKLSRGLNVHPTDEKFVDSRKPPKRRHLKSPKRAGLVNESFRSNPEKYAYYDAPNRRETPNPQFKTVFQPDDYNPLKSYEGKGHVNNKFTDPPRDTFTDAEGFSISALDFFKATAGFAIANHFAIRINIPDLLRLDNHVHGNTVAPLWTRDVELRAETVSMPGRNLNTTTDSNIYGPTREIVNGVGYSGEVDISFYADHELGERIFFEKWQELAYGNPDSTNRAFGRNTWNAKYYKDYIGSLEIYVLNKNDDVEYGLRLAEVYPKTIGPTELSQAPNGEIVKIPVSFAYRYWTNLGENTPELSPYLD